MGHAPEFQSGTLPTKPQGSSATKAEGMLTHIGSGQVGGLGRRAPILMVERMERLLFTSE